MANIFVFGSNLAGRHGRGAAKHARLYYGAQYGVGRGKTGAAYAIPTKNEYIHTLDLKTIQGYVDEFIIYAKQHPEHTFNVTAIGTGLAGYQHHQIAPMFAYAPSNCKLPEEWQAILSAHT